VQRDSFRVTGQGPAGTRILGVEQSQQFHASAPEETVTALREEIERQERAGSALNERINANADRRRWLAQLAEQSARSLSWSLARGQSKPEDISAFLAFVGEETQRAATATLDLTQELKDLTNTIEALRRQLAQLDGGWLPDRLAAAVRIAVTTPGVVVVSLSYLTGGASWRPRYDARVNVDTSSVRLTQQALVTQSTSEAWSGVALTLSTARPAVARQLPDEPKPWYLNVSSPPIMPPPPPMPAPRYAAAMSAPQGMFAAAAPLAAGAAMHDATPMPVELTLDEAVVERSGAAQVFHIAGDVDIPSDGMPHTLPISEDDLPGHMEYVAIPVESEGAHLRATVRNATGQALPAGELHIFHVGVAGDEYAGATKLDLTSDGADLKLYLGVDDNVSVKRELIERETDKGSLLQSGIRRVTLGYRITVANHTGATRRIIVKDRLPVPKNERIRLKTLDMKPQPAERTRLEQLTWDMQVPTGEERRIEWRFVVEAPADVELTGLPA
ncbi:MAG TPA: mucoidy inhibitor MuiA family protein, partial [Ktedonobacterales bacterium]|nr:mucoidy inhibitor MuiA family protein [Ktedonobacterales bacterium]